MAFTDLILSQPMTYHPQAVLLKGAPSQRALVPSPSPIGVWAGSPNMTIDVTETRLYLFAIVTDQAVEVALTPVGKTPNDVGIVPIPIHVPVNGVATYTCWVDRDVGVWVRLLA